MIRYFLPAIVHFRLHSGEHTNWHFPTDIPKTLLREDLTMSGMIANTDIGEAKTDALNTEAQMELYVPTSLASICGWENKYITTEGAAFQTMVKSVGRNSFIANEFTEMWKKRLQTGEEFRLLCSAEETRILTRPHDAIFIQKAVARIYDKKIAVAVDAFGCVGGDAMGMMYVHRGAKVHSIQRTQNPEERARFKRLVENLSSFRNACIRAGTISWYRSDIASFLKTTPLREISILHLAPPWAQGSDPKQVSPCADIRQFLKENVFDFMRVRPSIICIQLPRRTKNIQEWPGPGYALAECLHVRRRYFVYILRDQGAPDQHTACAL